ncbi:SurA N-terminal domain-containing protein [Ornithinimicrobium sp. Arc0846-15]|nr:SurA N-terminal domain-containing protein [Ornithinimicrobium laminariae]
MASVKKAIGTATAVTATLMLAACGASGEIEAGQAAVVDGVVITEADLQESTSQLNTVLGQPITPATALQTAITAPAIEKAFTDAGVLISDEALVTELQGSGIPTPNDITIDVARVIRYTTVLQDPTFAASAESAQVNEALSAMDASEMSVEINPRYGTWDPVQLGAINVDPPEWITSEQ